jgi:hypothetical protein
MSRRAREVASGVCGFLTASLVFIFVAMLWGIHIDRLGEVVVHRPALPVPRSTSPSAPPGGDALQPAPAAGQQPAPAPAGDEGSSHSPTDGDRSPHKPVDHGPPAVPPSEEADEPSTSTPASPQTTSPAAEPVTPSESSQPEPEPEAPGLLTPALTTVCEVADHLAHLC